MIQKHRSEVTRRWEFPDDRRSIWKWLRSATMTRALTWNTNEHGTTLFLQFTFVFENRPIGLNQAIGIVQAKSFRAGWRSFVALQLRQMRREMRDFTGGKLVHPAVFWPLIR